MTSLNFIFLESKKLLFVTWFGDILLDKQMLQIQKFIKFIESLGNQKKNNDTPSVTPPSV